MTPSYTERKPNAETQSANDVVVISPDGRNDSAIIHSDAIVRRPRLAANESTQYEVTSGRDMWLQVITSELRIGDEQLYAGDGASTETAGPVTIAASSEVDALLFDLSKAHSASGLQGISTSGLQCRNANISIHNHDTR